MSDHIIINDGEFVPIERVKRIREVSAEDRASLAKLGNHVDADRFNVRLDYADGGKSYAPESVDDIAKQVAIVQLDEDTFAPLQNIKKVKALNEQDRVRFEDRTGNPMREDFKSRIETSAGNMLSTADGETIMRRLRTPYKRGHENISSPSLPVASSKADYVQQRQAKGRSATSRRGPAHGVNAQKRSTQREAPREQ